MAKVITDFQHLTLDDIIEWCQDNKQVEWLKQEAQKKFERKIYPKVETISKNGKKSWKLDKTKPYIVESTPITFMELKANFLKEFFDIAPKTKKLTMYEKIAAL